LFLQARREGLTLEIRSDFHRRGGFQLLNYELANSGLVRDHPQIKGTEIDHFQSDLAIEAGMDSRRGEVDHNPQTGEGTTAFNSRGKLIVAVEMDTLTSNGKHMPRMFAEGREDD